MGQSNNKNKNEIEEEIMNELSMIDFQNIYLPPNEEDKNTSLSRIKHKMELKKKNLIDKEKQYLDYFDNL